MDGSISWIFSGRKLLTKIFLMLPGAAIGLLGGEEVRSMVCCVGRGGKVSRSLMMNFLGVGICWGIPSSGALRGGGSGGDGRLSSEVEAEGLDSSSTGFPFSSR